MNVSNLSKLPTTKKFSENASDFSKTRDYLVQKNTNLLDSSNKPSHSPSLATDISEKILSYPALSIGAGAALIGGCYFLGSYLQHHKKPSIPSSPASPPLSVVIGKTIQYSLESLGGLIAVSGIGRRLSEPSLEMTKLKDQEATLKKDLQKNYIKSKKTKCFNMNTIPSVPSNHMARIFDNV